MKKRNLSIVSVLVVGVMLAAIFLPVGRIVASGGQQHNIWGSAEHGDNPLAATPSYEREITAWIDGVSYGSNITLPGTAMFDLYVDGDVWGIKEDDSVKDGGWYGNSIYYFLDYDPMYYYLNISTTTSTFDPIAYEHVDPMYFDTMTYSDGNYPAGTFLRALKIQEIVLKPNDIGAQYVYLYDFGGELDEAKLEDATHGYYLQKDDNVTHTTNGDTFEFSDWPNDVVQAGNYFYINLNASSGFELDKAEDELKLVWKNPVNWGGGATEDNIANGTDVIVDRVEWGNYENWIDPLTPPDNRDYDNTTLLDYDGPMGSAGQSLNRSSPGVDTDNCAADFVLESVAAPRPVPPKPEGTPGSPTDLRVHKGGGPWGGTATDLVLTWTAPIVDYEKLAKNIVYYDTDLSDGFQYSNYLEFTPNSGAAGDLDWCVLPNFLADANNYVLRVNTTGLTKGSYENLTGTNVGYKTSIVLDSSIIRIWISIPYLSDYDYASDITDDSFPNNDVITAVERWNYSTQNYDSRLWQFGTWMGNFDIEPGDAISVSINPVGPGLPYTWKIVGAYDPNFEFEFIRNVGTTDFKMGSLPYHRTYQMASDVTAEFTWDKVYEIAQYNYVTLRWDERVWSPGAGQYIGEFAIYPSPADAMLFQITASTTFYWKPQVMTF